MFIVKSFKNKNANVIFVESLKGFQTEIFDERRKDIYKKRRVIYSNIPIKKVKRNSRRIFKVDNDSYQYLIVVEEENFRKEFFIYIEYSMKIKKIEFPANSDVSSNLVSYVNKVIDKENDLNSKIDKYHSLPEFIQNCINLEDIEYFYEAIDNSLRYSRQEYRLDCLEFVIHTKSIKCWLSKMGIYTTQDNQKDLDNLAIYVARLLVETLSKVEKEIFLKKINKIERENAKKY